MSARAVDGSAAAVAIVTGGSSGAGRELVEALARRGFAVVLVYLSDQRRAEAIVDAVLARSGTALAVRADVADDLDVQRVFDETTFAFGGADMVVHAAPRAADVVLEHAERRLRWGGATLTVSDTRDVPAALSCVDRWSSTTAG